MPQRFPSSSVQRSGRSFQPMLAAAVSRHSFTAMVCMISPVMPASPFCSTFFSRSSRIYPQLLGDPVHLPLVSSGHLRDAKAKIGGSQGLIGHVYIGIHLGVRDLVGAVGGKACVVVHPGLVVT